MEGEIIPSDAAILAHVERDPYQPAMLTWLEGKTDNTRRATPGRFGSCRPTGTPARSSPWTWLPGRRT